MYIYKKSENKFWTVGYILPNGQFVSESDWDTSELAAKRVNYLNGGSGFSSSEMASLMIAIGGVGEINPNTTSTVWVPKVAALCNEIAKAILQEANK